MRYASIALFLLNSFFAGAQMSPLSAKVYYLENSPTDKTKTGNIQSIFTGSGAILASHQMKCVSINKGKSLVYAANKSKEERFFIVKNGPVKVKLGNESALLERGSVIVLLPGDELAIKNEKEEMASIYEMAYQSIAPIDIDRAVKAGPSFMMHWNDMVFKAHEKGSVRQLFDRQTAMLNRFDIHVTTLNKGFKSHDPHTHKNEEIILMMEGNAEMQIGTDHQKANAGDVVLLNSMVLHNLTNVGDTPCQYFAIQWN
jgi:(S)-ureidoglycine aminohydrolase